MATTSTTGRPKDCAGDVTQGAGGIGDAAAALAHGGRQGEGADQQLQDALGGEAEAGVADQHRGGRAQRSARQLLHGRRLDSTARFDLTSRPEPTVVVHPSPSDQRWVRGRGPQRSGRAGVGPGRLSTGHVDVAAPSSNRPLR